MKNLNGIPMFRFLICTTLIVLSLNAKAEVHELSREYTYQASENDSKLSARKAALKMVQVILIADIGFKEQVKFLGAGSQLDNAEFDRKIQENHEILSQALSNIEILNESWDGESFYLRAGMTVDSVTLVNKFKEVYADPIPSCISIHIKSVELFDKGLTLEVQSKLLALSKKYGFTEFCSQWQYGIMLEYAKNQIDDEVYRKHIFTSIINQESDSLAGEMLIYALKYALKIKPLTNNEWSAVSDGLHRGDRNTFESVIALLIDHSQNDTPTKSNTKKQSYKEFMTQIDDLKFSAYNMNIYYSDPVSENEVVYTFLEKGLIKQPILSKEYFLNYFEKLNDSQKEALAAKVVERQRHFSNYDSHAVLINYMGWVNINEEVANILFPLISDFRNEDRVFGKGKKDYSDFGNFIKWHNKEIKQIITFANLSESVKNEWITEYKL